MATFLRTAPANVQQLIEDGKLQGFKVAGEWRVLWVAIEDFLRREMAAEQRRAFTRQISDPRTWVRAMSSSHRAWLKKQDYKEGTWGGWLQEALLAEEREREADNIVPLEPRRD